MIFKNVEMIFKNDGVQIFSTFGDLHQGSKIFVPHHFGK